MRDCNEGAAVAGGAHPAGKLVGNSLAEVGGVAGVEVAVFAASEDVDVVRGVGIGCGSPWVLVVGTLHASARHTSGPVKSALRAYHGAPVKAAAARPPTGPRPRGEAP